MGQIEALARRIFPGPARVAVERVAEGVSTHVYRVRRGGEVFYLRVLPEAGASFAPEVRVHALLRERGVSVPEVVYFEHRNEALQRSVMVTTAIAGDHVGRRPVDDDTGRILVAAGRDLAVINSIPVAGFGWIERDRGPVAHLRAEHPTHRAFVLEHFEEDLALLGEQALKGREIAAIREIVARWDGWLDVAGARLAHGDFDATHIFQHGGRYSGIIDFGEIRGGDPCYDLGHFRLHDGETLPIPVLSQLLAGYREAAPLPPDCERRIALSSLLIGIRALARGLRRQPRRAYPRLIRAAIGREIAALRA